MTNTLLSPSSGYQNIVFCRRSPFVTEQRHNIAKFIYLAGTCLLCSIHLYIIVNTHSTNDCPLSCLFKVTLTLSITETFLPLCALLLTTVKLGALNFGHDDIRGLRITCLSVHISMAAGFCWQPVILMEADVMCMRLQSKAVLYEAVLLFRCAALCFWASPQATAQLHSDYKYILKWTTMLKH